MPIARNAQLPKDGDKNAIQTGRTYTHLDATEPTAFQSPLAVSSAAIELVPPAEAVSLIITPFSNPVRVARQATFGGAGNGYEIIAVGNYAAFDVSDSASTFVIRDGSDLTIQFRYIAL